MERENNYFFLGYQEGFSEVVQFIQDFENEQEFST